MYHEKLVTSDTLAEFKKESPRCVALVYFRTTRDIVAALQEMMENSESATDLQQKLSDFCEDRVTLLRKAGCTL